MKARIFVVLVSLVIFLPSIGLAQGGWAALPAQAFIVVAPAYQWGTVIGWGTESYIYPSGAGTPTFVAPVIFPAGADGLSVRQMNATVGDFDNGGFITVKLFRMNRYSGISQEVYSASSQGPEAPGKIVLTDAVGSYRFIDSSKYVWFVRVWFPYEPAHEDDLRFYAVRIKYQ